MGRANLSNCASQPDVVVTAACDVDENRLEPTVEQYKGTCRGYRDYREMLQHKDLDAVIIATLPHWHALQAIAACEAGKDLYLQKPMTLHLAESLAVRNAVKKHNRISQVGTQHHAREEHRRVDRIRPLRQPGTDRRGAHVQRHEPDAQRHRHRRLPNAARGARLGPLVRARPARALQPQAGRRRLPSLFLDGLQRRLDPRQRAAHDRPSHHRAGPGLPPHDQRLRRPLRGSRRRRCLRSSRGALAVSEPDADLDDVAHQQLRLRPARRSAARGRAWAFISTAPTAPSTPITWAHPSLCPRARP